MAVFTRVNGDAQGINNLGSASKANANAAVIMTGVANPISFIRVEVGGNLAAQLGSGGAVESIINSISANATVMGYQIDSVATSIDAGSFMSQISVLVERSAWTSNAALVNVIAAAGTVNGLALTANTAVKVFGDKGFNLARGIVATGSSHSIVSSS